MPGWRGVDWRRADDDVRRLRQRIFAASQAGDLKRVRNLQRLMLRSRANALVSVRRVTEINAGRKTAGIDGRVVLLDQQKAELAGRVQRGPGSWKPLPVKRVFIPKRGGKRGLGIPVITDRALQAATVNALEPEWEARLEPRSYGFRPGRSCQDAIAAIFWTVASPRARRCWVLAADLTAAFDRADHDHIRRQIGTFPAREAVAGWLRAGVIDQGRFAPTERGTPQGGVFTPLTQWITSASRSRSATGGWDGHGVPPAVGDITGSMFMSWLGIVLALVSTPGASTRPPIWQTRGCRRLRRSGSWPAGSAARRGRPAAMWNERPGPVVWRRRRPPRCSRSSCQRAWRGGCAGMPGRRGSPFPPWWRRRWRSSCRGAAETVPAGERPAGRGGVRVRPARGHGAVGGLRHLGASAPGPHRAAWPGRKTPA